MADTTQSTPKRKAAKRELPRQIVEVFRVQREAAARQREADLDEAAKAGPGAPWEYGND